MAVTDVSQRNQLRIKFDGAPSPAYKKNEKGADQAPCHGSQPLPPFPGNFRLRSGLRTRVEREEALGLFETLHAVFELRYDLHKLVMKRPQFCQ